MKRLFSILLLVAGALGTCFAQNWKEVIERDPARLAGTYYVYDADALPALTPAPAGYKPIYISHFGRHGARYCTSEYDPMHEWLTKAHKARILTEKGERFHTEYEAFYQKVRYCKGNLTEVGKKQHRNIAIHMFERFPEVFSGPTHVVAASTESPRVIQSMWSCLSGLQSRDDEIDFDADASARFAPWLQPVLSSNPYYVKERTRVNSATRKKLDDYTSRTLPAKEIMLRLFTDLDAASAVLKTSPETFVKSLHSIVSGTRCLDEDQGIFDWLVSEEEMRLMWKVVSAAYFSSSGNLEDSGSMLVDYAAFTTEQVIECADADMASGDTQLRLRFGHDASLMPFITFLDMNGVGRSTSSFEESLEIFPNYYVPMGCSAQLIFYRNQANRILVKALLNEEEATLPFKAVEGPYYDWQDFKDYYASRIAASKERVNAAVRAAAAKAKAAAVQPREKSVEVFRATDWGWKPVAGSYVEAGSATIEVFGGVQTVSLVRFPMKRQMVSVLESDGPSSAVVSKLGADNHALAAINGGFFNKEHLPVSYVKEKGKVVSTREDKAASSEGLFLIKGKKGRKVDIVTVGSQGFDQAAKGWREAIATGPVLIEDGKRKEMGDAMKRLTDRRHPRTLVGYTSDGWIYFIVVDGRFPYRADGMSVAEMQTLCEGLGLYEAINLDGGGSATMWNVDDGVMNHPYDNRKFDHAGERVVPNALIVK